MKAAVARLSVIFVVCLLGLAMAWSAALPVHGQVLQWAGWPVSIWLCLLAFCMQWLMLLPAYWLQSEKAYDLTGSVTFITVVSLPLILHPQVGSGQWLLAGMVIVWAVRLGTFLFRRILQDKNDSRFDDIKPYFLRFAITWTLQGLWVLITASTVLAVVTQSQSVSWLQLNVFGVFLWAVGLAIESLADYQKRRFRRQRSGQPPFISSGLWAYSRHPNYFGEILLWLGIAIAALPLLSGWQYVSLLSPVFVTMLLVKVSGIPLLEAKAQSKWGEREDYQLYVLTTPVLVPFTRPQQSQPAKPTSKH